MTQIHAALSHYWHLRDQGLDPERAVAHVKQRFGVDLDRERLLPEAATVVVPQTKYRQVVTCASTPSSPIGIV